MIRSTSRRSTYVCSAAVLLLGVLTSPAQARPRPHKKVTVAPEATAPAAPETATAPATQAVPEAAPPLAMPAAALAPGAPMGVPTPGLVRAAATEPPPAVAFPPPPPPEPTPPPAPAPSNAPTVVKGKWSPVIYGFIELDALRDSTQSFQEPAGNGIIQRTETFAGSHGRTMFGVRNSRFGFKLTAPDVAVPANLICGQPSAEALSVLASAIEASWAPVNRTYAGVPEVPPAWLFEHRRDVRIVDVREPAELDGELGHIEGAELLPLGALRGGLAAWDNSAATVVVCRSGARSAQGALTLEAAGFGRVGNLAGGMIAWRSAGHPVIGGRREPRTVGRSTPPARHDAIDEEVARRSS